MKNPEHSCTCCLAEMQGDETGETVHLDVLHTVNQCEILIFTLP